VCCVSLILFSLIDGAGRAANRPETIALGDFSPDDMRAPDEISGHYTLVSSKWRWPNKIIVWGYDPLLSNFSKFNLNISEKNFYR